ncbi:uncharacterized protein LOC106011146 [Aplysia californica]|uniref:Uncharacterized protein LOC106011146 n=1 Tax=Aplysia californica TaxID=6500 RepID=A0ABM0ZVB5_APLCA|nr:uncharacterized protein LOC106011146 [Aplysia californica]
MLNTLVPPQISTFSAIRPDLNRALLVNAHVPPAAQHAIEENSNPSQLECNATVVPTSTNNATHSATVDTSQPSTFGYQITLTAVVPDEGEGLKHKLVLKESTAVPNLQEFNTPRTQRRSSRVAKRSKSTAITPTGPSPSKRRITTQKSSPAINTSVAALGPSTSRHLSNTSPGPSILSRPPHPAINNLLESFQPSTSPSSISTTTIPTNFSSTDPQTMPEQTREYQLVPEAAAMMSDSDLGLTFDENEQKIVHATIEAFQTGTLTPLIKEELRCTIQSRRLAQGKGELQVEFKSPPKKKEMTDEERKRSVKRRQQNREAAQRFRQRQKDTSDYLSAKISRLQKSSESLIKDLQHLRKERDELQEMLRSHLVICNSHQHGHQTAGVDVDHILNNLSSSTGEIPQTGASACPDTGGSASSVFFSDDYTDSGCVQVIEPNEELSKMLENSHGICYADDEVSGVLEGVEERYLETPPEVCYEEIVLDDIMEVSEYGAKERLDSCSSVDTYMTYDSFASETPSLSESTSDVRHSLSSAYSRVHMSSSSSEPFEARFMDQDFLLYEEETP